MGCFAASSNGLASGNHLLEAISHGLCEVIERDATTLWHLLDEAAQANTRVDLDSVDDPACRSALEHCFAAGMAVVAWDMSHDIALPSYQCLIAESTQAADRLVYTSTGMGCHVNRGVAFLRALTEAAQSRLTLIAGSRDDVFRDDYAIDARRAESVRHLLAQAHDSPPRRAFDAAPSYDRASFEEDVELELELLEAAGVECVAVVDLTTEFEVPVVRVVVPGLEGSDKMPGYVPGQRAQARGA
jgi:YcaO-like protein with predicted kinase domain